MSTKNNSFNLCNAHYNYSEVSNNYNCDDFEECVGQRIIVSKNDSSYPVCCTAYLSCNNAKNITYESETDSDVAIRCDGVSCGYAGYITATTGNLYFTGSDIFTGTIEPSSEYDVFCTGQQSCSDKFIRNGKHLYCTGGNACRDSGGIYNFDSVYGYSALALHESTIEYIQNLYCGGQASCYETVISNVFDSVYGFNLDVLKSSSISHVKNNVVAVGYSAMYQSEVYNVTNVYCISTQSCMDAMIRGVHNKIEVNGINALSGSLIISETNFDENGTLIIYINGTNDDRYDIYCNETDICKIECESNHACTELVLHCDSHQSQCLVSCDEENEIHCPRNGSYSEWIITTIPPTAIPSTIPTKIPSFAPSFVFFANTTMKSSIINISTSSTLKSIIMTTTKFVAYDFDTTDENPDNKIDISDNVLIVILVSIGVFALLLVICMCLLFIYCGKKQSQNRHERNFGLVIVKKTQPPPKRNVIVKTKGEIIDVDLQQTTKTPKAPAANSMYTDQNTISINSYDQPIRNPKHDNQSRDESIENLFKDLIDVKDKDFYQNIANGKGTGEELYVHNKVDINTKIGETNDNGATKSYTSGQDTTTNQAHDLRFVQLVPHEQWTQKQVLLWIKAILLQNGFKNAVIVKFLREFAKYHKNGELFTKFQKDEQFSQQFIQQFSQVNQNHSIWVVIKSSIIDI